MIQSDTAENPISGGWTPEALEAASRNLENAEPQEIVQWALDNFFPDITLACSFGGVSGMVLLDMALKINPDTPVFYIDTNFLFPETYALRDKAAQRYSFQPIGFKTDLTPEKQAETYGEALWSRDPDLCCELRKVKPNAQALSGRRAWIAGLRRDQGDTRKDVAIVDWDSKFNLVKINPLANWTEDQLWNYIRENNILYNPLHDQGYPSIGCTHCTRAVQPGEDPRAGRWSDFEEKVECGIHIDPETAEVTHTSAS